MRILNRYIRNTVISTTALVTLVLIGLNFLIELLTEVSEVGHNHYTLLLMYQYIVMNLPALVYVMFPIAAFIGCLLGLGRLATGSELTVMQANGISVSEITWSVIKAALLMVIIVSVMGETVAPKWQQKAILIKAQALGRADAFGRASQLWLHQGDRYLYIDQVVTAVEINGVSEFIFDKNGLHEIDYAESGHKVGSHWELYRISKTIITSDHTQTQQQDQETLHFNFVANQLHDFDGMTLQGSVVDLWHTIAYRQSAGLLTTLFELNFWQRVIQPVTTLVMICLGIPFIFGSLRNVSAAIRLVTGISVGIVFYMLNRFFGPLTLIYQLPPLLGAMGPALFFLSIYVYMMLRRKS